MNAQTLKKKSKMTGNLYNFVSFFYEKFSDIYFIWLLII